MKYRHLLMCVPVLCLACASVSVASEDAPAQKSSLERYDFDEYGRQPISFYYCQAGFQPDGYKPIYIWTREPFSGGLAVLRNCATGKSTSIPLKSRGVNIWGRQDWIADCSGVQAEGDYTLRVEFGGQSAETKPFAINKNCYADLQEKAAKHYFLKRCGIFCHTHDGNLYSLEPDSFGKVLRHVPAYGGWHDAHDDDKWMWLAWSSVYGLLKTQERFSPQWHGSNEPYPYCLAEAWWEVEWLLRMQKPDGTFYYAVTEWFPQLANRQGERMTLQIHHVGDQTYDDLHQDRRAVLDVWGKGEVDRLMGATAHNFASTAPKYFAYCAHILRYCGRLMRPYDKNNAQRCVAGASKTVAYLENLKEYPSYQELEVHAALASTGSKTPKTAEEARPWQRPKDISRRCSPVSNPRAIFIPRRPVRDWNSTPRMPATSGFLWITRSPTCRPCSSILNMPGRINTNRMHCWAT